MKFARDRDAYRAVVREALQEFDVALLDYGVTRNPVPLLVEADDRLEISGLMQKVAGEVARSDNRRKGRTNAFWGDNHHATLVDGRGHLWRCREYLELNSGRPVTQPIHFQACALVTPTFLLTASGDSPGSRECRAAPRAGAA